MTQETYGELEAENLFGEIVGETYGESPFSEAAGWFGEPAIRPTVPAFRFICPTGCAPHAANECTRIVRRAIQDAIWLAENAATKLKARDNEALRLFRGFFGDPSRPVPWANNRPAADLVADRFRAVAHGFRTRVPHVRCSTRAGLADRVRASARRANCRSFRSHEIQSILCPPFWSAAPEPCQVLARGHAAPRNVAPAFLGVFGHQENLPRPGDPEERRRDNSNCYQAFALRVAGMVPIRMTSRSVHSETRLTSCYGRNGVEE